MIFSYSVLKDNLRHACIFLATGTLIHHYNATQAIHSDLSQRVVWKCYKIEPFLKLRCMQRDKFVDRRVRKLFPYEGHARKSPLISNTSANQIHTQLTALMISPFSTLELDKVSIPRHNLTAGVIL
jgi:hypothetical protein